MTYRHWMGLHACLPGNRSSSSMRPQSQGQRTRQGPATVQLTSPNAPASSKRDVARPDADEGRGRDVITESQQVAITGPGTAPANAARLRPVNAEDSLAWQKQAQAGDSRQSRMRGSLRVSSEMPVGTKILFSSTKLVCCCGLGLLSLHVARVRFLCSNIRIVFWFWLLESRQCHVLVAMTRHFSVGCCAFCMRARTF